MELLKDGKLTKADYMRLPKERLAELLVERDNQPNITYIPSVSPCLPDVPIEPYYSTSAMLKRNCKDD